MNAIASVSLPQSSVFEYHGDPTWLTILLLGGAVVLVFLVLQFLNHTRRLTEARLKTAESLAKQGLLSDSQLRKLLEPPRLGRRSIYFVAWVLMLAGLYFFMMSFMSISYGHTYFLRGIVLTFISTGIFATPFLFRELEKQGWI
ncbi:MAG: hypothetical protein H6832_05530 [Planctomycetes bacterium]|nr:hypothetical protein [Planctomycetota bacterium]MCB9881041.1 hypothetical protein [Planctomycetota bacterium]MCB9917844.1 hypothetical protein [Planctomycetota bacterium]